MLSIRKQFLKSLMKCLGYNDSICITILRAARLVDEKMALSGLIKHHFSGSGDANALLRTAMGLKFHAEGKYKKYIMLLLRFQNCYYDISVNFGKCIYCSNIF